MVGMIKRETLASHWWWFDSHNTSKRSPWLQSTLEVLDQKTESMLKLIEQDADSFAQRAEMYYKKRPDLISMVEDFYRAHRSLAEKYDLLKSDSATRLRTSLGSPFSSTKLFQSDKLSYVTDQTYDSYSETYDPEESAESEVDDPDHEDETNIADKQCSDKEALSEFSYEEVNLTENLKLKQKDEEKIDLMSYDEMRKLKEEVKRLEEENRSQKDQLRQKVEDMTELRRQLSFNVVGHNEVLQLKVEIKKLEEEKRVQEDQLRQKDEEKIAAIRQLSFAVDMLKEENVKLKKFLVRDSPKKSSPFEFNKLKDSLLGKLFNGSPRHRSTIIAL